MTIERLGSHGDDQVDRREKLVGRDGRRRPPQDINAERPGARFLVGDDQVGAADVVFCGRIAGRRGSRRRHDAEQSCGGKSLPGDDHVRQSLTRSREIDGRLELVELHRGRRSTRLPKRVRHERSHTKKQKNPTARGEAKRRGRNREEADSLIITTLAAMSIVWQRNFSNAAAGYSKSNPI